MATSLKCVRFINQFLARFGKQIKQRTIRLRRVQRIWQQMDRLSISLPIEVADSLHDIAVIKTEKTETLFRPKANPIWIERSAAVSKVLGCALSFLKTSPSPDALSFQTLLVLRLERGAFLRASSQH